MNIYDSLIKAQEASQSLALLTDQDRQTLLQTLIDELQKEQDFILKENRKDLAYLNIEDPMYDRLLLTEQRLISMINDIGQVIELDSPLNRVLEKKTMPNGLMIEKITVPLGVVGVIYESRPNVTIDVFALCFKAGNACILKGGQEAFNSNKVLVDIIIRALRKCNINSNSICLLPPSREASYELINATGLVDVCIPRGGKNLINFVRTNARIPIIETGAGVVHIYFDVSGDLNKGQTIIDNAKIRRVSVCNALDTLIIHQERLKDLVVLTKFLQEKNVEILADEESYRALPNYPLKYHANLTDFGHEFLAKKMAIKTVKSVQEAVEHIRQYSSGHSEAIIAEDSYAINYFLARVDAAVLYLNASTAFTDGAQFGMGAEIGISTQKLHARGPMAADALTSYKWIVRGTGQIRP